MTVGFGTRCAGAERCRLGVRPISLLRSVEPDSPEILYGHDSSTHEAILLESKPLKSGILIRRLGAMQYEPTPLSLENVANKCNTCKPQLVNHGLVNRGLVNPRFVSGLGPLDNRRDSL